MYHFYFRAAEYHKVKFQITLIHIYYYKIPFRHLISTVIHCHVASLTVTEFYFLQSCYSAQFQKFDSLISFFAQAKYGSELGEDYQNTIFKPDLIQISQEYAHTSELLEQYLQHLALCCLTQRAYHIPMDFFLKLNINCISHDVTQPYQPPKDTICVSLQKYKIILKDLNRQKNVQSLSIITIYKQIDIIYFANILYISLFFLFKKIVDSYSLPSLISHYTLLLLPHLGLMVVVGWGIYIYLPPLTSPLSTSLYLGVVPFI